MLMKIIFFFIIISSSFADVNVNYQVSDCSKEYGASNAHSMDGTEFYFLLPECSSGYTVKDAQIRTINIKSNEIDGYLGRENFETYFNLVGIGRNRKCLTQTLCEKEFPFAKLKESNKIMKNKLSTVNEKIGELQLDIDLDKANIYRLYGFIIVTSFILIYVFMSTISSILGTLISKIFGCFSSCVKIKRKIKRLYLFWIKDRGDEEIITPRDELV